MLTVLETIKNLMDNFVMMGLFVVGATSMVKAINEIPTNHKKRRKNITVTQSKDKAA